MRINHDMLRLHYSPNTQAARFPKRDNAITPKLDILLRRPHKLQDPHIAIHPHFRAPKLHEKGRETGIQFRVRKFHAEAVPPAPREYHLALRERRVLDPAFGDEGVWVQEDGGILVQVRDGH